MTKTQQKEWNDWIATRPPVIQKLCQEYPPGKYILKTTNQIISLYSYSEDGTVTVNISCKDNPTLIFDRQVFGISVKNLRRC
jgi:hypothetical protein